MWQHKKPANKRHISSNKLEDITEEETNISKNYQQKLFHFTKPNLNRKVLKNVDDKDKYDDFF